MQPSIAAGAVVLWNGMMSPCRCCGAHRGRLHRDWWKIAEAGLGRDGGLILSCGVHPHIKNRSAWAVRNNWPLDTWRGEKLRDITLRR